MTEIFRIETNAWGQEILLGLSWSWLWVFFAAGLGFVILHILFMWFIDPKMIRKRKI
ncbi:uncharacterized protein METZ01_LOCUS81715 [marine metagenome]|uniref:Uncharacterized protein n=1 Tax=marine metagenome TaxID=408172 RepID=A0A381UM84_9ZZZZ